jgi:hypothetical protein
MQAGGGTQSTLQADVLNFALQTTPYMSSATINRKKRIAERVMQIDQEKFLDQIDEVLLRMEMQARVNESVAELERGEGISLETHRSNAAAWIQAQRTK